MARGFSKSRLFANFIRRINDDLEVKTAALEPEARVTTEDVLDSAQVSSIVTSSSLDSAAVVNLIDSDYVQLRQSSVGSGGVDSAAVVNLIDSDYVQLRQSSSGVDSAAVTSIISDTANYVQLNQTGTLEVTTGTVRWVAPKNINIEEVESRVGTAPTGSSLITTLNKNGSTIDTQTIAASGTSDTNTGLSLAVTENDYLTVDITQVGSTVAGSDLNVIVKYKDG